MEVWNQSSINHQKATQTFFHRLSLPAGNKKKFRFQKIALRNRKRVYSRTVNFNHLLIARKVLAKNGKDTSSRKLSGISNGQLENFTVKSKI
jgi:hypothetical protein